MDAITKTQANDEQQPGAEGDRQASDDEGRGEEVDALRAVVRKMFPSNVLKASDPEQRTVGREAAD